MKAPAYKSIVKASRKAARNANMHLSKGCEIFQQKQAACCLLLRRRLSLKTLTQIQSDLCYTVATCPLTQFVVHFWVLILDKFCITEA